jgi:hypothetical protein
MCEYRATAEMVERHLKYGVGIVIFHHDMSTTNNPPDKSTIFTLLILEGKTKTMNISIAAGGEQNGRYGHDEL